jgi:hypothetical protein
MPPPPWLSSVRMVDLVHILPFSGGRSFSPLCTESDIVCHTKHTDPPNPIPMFSSDPSDPVFSQLVATGPRVLDSCHISACDALCDIMLREVISRSGFTVEFCNCLASYCNDYLAIITHFNSCITLITVTYVHLYALFLLTICTILLVFSLSLRFQLLPTHFQFCRL